MGDGFPFGTVVKKYILLMLRQKRPPEGRTEICQCRREREREREKAGRSFGFIAARCIVKCYIYIYFHDGKPS